MFAYRRRIEGCPTCFDESPQDRLIWRTCVAKIPVVDMSEPNPMQAIIRRQLGVDAFALDGDETSVVDSWDERPRKREIIRVR